MKKLTAIVFAFAMIISIVFVAEAVPSSTSFSVNKMSTQVRERHRRHGVVRRGYYHSKRGVKKGWYKTKHGTKWTAHKTKRGTQHTYRKIKSAVQ